MPYFRGLTVFFFTLPILAQHNYSELTLTYPEDGANSYRVLQDFRWNKNTENGILYDFKMFMYTDSTQELVYSYENLDQNAELTNFGQFSVCVFNPLVFMPDYESQNEMSGMPILTPGRKYRWEVTKKSSNGTVSTKSRVIHILHDPNFKVGINTHFSTPAMLYPEMFSAFGGSIQTPVLSEDNIIAMVNDIDDYSFPYLFEGMAMAWCREFQSTPYLEMDYFMNAYDQMQNKPTIIGNYFFQPYRVRNSGGTPIFPIFGTDFFTMFDIHFDGQTVTGDDAVFIDHDTYEIRQDDQVNALFGRNDPRLRPPALFSVFESGVAKKYDDLVSIHNDIMCMYFEWRVEQSAAKETELRDFIDVQRNKSYTYVENSNILSSFNQYVQGMVNRYPSSKIPIWHFLNEPNGAWNVEPRLYAHLISKFNNAVKTADPDSQVMAASLVFWDGFWHSRGIPKIILDINPAIAWLESFAEELKSMKLSGEISELPFKYIGLNFYMPVDQNFWYNNYTYPNPYIDCPTHNDIADKPCSDSGLQDCLFTTYITYYIEVNRILSELEAFFYSDEKIGVFIKEHAINQGKGVNDLDHDFTYSGERSHIGRTVALFHELGDITRRDCPTSNSNTNNCPAEEEFRSNEGLRSDPNINRVKGVLYHHYYLTTRAPLIENYIHPPTEMNRTMIGDKLKEINDLNCLQPDASIASVNSVTCGESVDLHPIEPENESYSYAWSANGQSIGSGYNCSYTPSFGSMVTLTITNECEQVVLEDTDTVPVDVKYLIKNVSVSPTSVQTGEILNISWSSSCGLGAWFDVYLVKDQGTNPMLIRSLDQHSFQWVVEDAVPCKCDETIEGPVPCKCYKIRVVSSSGNYRDSEDFEIVNLPPVINQEFTMRKSTAQKEYSFSLSGLATDPDNFNLSFNLISGPDWLNLSESGEVSGTPSSTDVGLSDMLIEVSDTGDKVLTNLTILTKQNTDNIGILDCDDNTQYLDFDPVSGIPDEYSLNELSRFGKFVQPLYGDWHHDGSLKIGIFSIPDGSNKFETNIFNSRVISDETHFLNLYLTDEINYSSMTKCFYGDWDGDGRDTLLVLYNHNSIYTKTHFLFALLNELQTGPAETFFEFVCDVSSAHHTIYPVIGDFNGDGKDSVGIIAVQEGSANVYLASVLTEPTTIPDQIFSLDFPSIKGTPIEYNSIKPIMGDWNGDGVDTPCILYSPSNYMHCLYFWNSNVTSSSPDHTQGIQILSSNTLYPFLCTTPN